MESLVGFFIFICIFMFAAALVAYELHDRAMLREMRQRIAQIVIVATIRAEKLKHDWR